MPPVHKHINALRALSLSFINRPAVDSVLKTKRFLRQARFVLINTFEGLAVDINGIVIAPNEVLKIYMNQPFTLW